VNEKEGRRKRSYLKPFLVIMVIVIGAVLAAKGVDRWTENMAQGNIHETHEFIDKCRYCHLPMQEVRPINCARVACHPPAKFREKAGKVKALLVQHVKIKDCTGCHTEHVGKKADITFEFKHASLEDGEKCGGCHIQPVTHAETVDADCVECHGSESFAKPKENRRASGKNDE